MKAYIDIVKNVMETGVRKENRTGIDTFSTFHHSYELHFGELAAPAQNHYALDGRFPLLTTKSIAWKNIVIEMLWFLSGHTNISILKRHGCKFWDAWTDESGKVPSAYGNFWRHFPTHETREADSIRAVLGAKTQEYPAFNDQIRWVVEELKKNPMSRRMVVSAWAPGNAQTSKLPPCHMQFILNVQNLALGERHLCMHMTQRSCDVALGVPYNIASYALLLHLFSRFSGIKPGIFAHTLVDSHIYTSKPDGSQSEFDHLSGLHEQIRREPRNLPRLHISEKITDLRHIEELMLPSVSTEEVMSHFVLEGYDPHPAINFKVAV
jgi:thymidylate synthase